MTLSAIVPLLKVYCKLYTLLLFGPKTFSKICFKFTSPKIPRVFLSVKTVCNETISFDKLSIFFWASSIFDNLSKTEANVLFVFSKFWSNLSFTLSLIWFNLFSIFSFILIKFSLVFLAKSLLNSPNSLTTSVSSFPSLSVIFDSLTFLVNAIILTINIMTNNPIIIYSILSPSYLY